MGRAGMNNASVFDFLAAHVPERGIKISKVTKCHFDCGNDAMTHMMSRRPLPAPLPLLSALHFIFLYTLAQILCYW
jgi:hypothetical protein